ncbi:hypothetical protein ACFWDA_25120 [Rhodococcus zopfii]|uniref:hypothetical protein n=1 Tax=Rhodococcus zopfii TaxID=43772 RepID=UPI003667C397
MPNSTALPLHVDTSADTRITTRIAAAKDQLDAIHREVRAIADTVSTIDLDGLDVGQHAALLEVLDSLADANRTITSANDPFASAIWHSRHLP